MVHFMTASYSGVCTVRFNMNT